MSYYKELFRLASLIVEARDELSCLIKKGNVDVNSNKYLDIVNRLKQLILEENEIISKMTILDIEETFKTLKAMLQLNSTLEFYDKLNSCEEIENYLNSDFKKSDYINSNLSALVRVFYRLKNMAFMLTDGKLKLSVDYAGKMDAYTYVSKWEALESVIHISILKSMDSKINSLNPENDDEEIKRRDNKIIKNLRDYLLKYYFNVAFSNFDIEFRSIFSGFDLGKQKMMDINSLVRGNRFEKDEFDAFICNEFKNLLEEFLSITCYDSVYNATILFSMLRVVTAIEVLLPYVNINMIDEDTYLDVLCDKDGEINTAAVNSYVRKRVRWVLKDTNL